MNATLYRRLCQPNEGAWHKRLYN